MCSDSLKHFDTVKLLKFLQLFDRCKCDRCQKECAKIQEELDKRSKCATEDHELSISKTK